MEKEGCRGRWLDIGNTFTFAKGKRIRNIEGKNKKQKELEKPGMR